VALAGLLWFVASVVALHLLLSTFEPTHRFLSEYVRSSYGWLMTANFLVLSVSAFCLARALFCLQRTEGHLRHPAILLAIAALFLLLLGLFPSDLQEAPKSLDGIIHDRLSVIPFLLVFFAAVLLMRVVHKDPIWSGLKTGSYVLGSLGLFGVVAGWVTQGSISWTGLVQRIIVAPVLLWLTGLTLVLFRVACSPK
jgi:hypothetical membrane protein